MPHRDKVAVVTGSNSGIGKETAKELAAKGARVVMVCRDIDKAKSAQQDIMALTGSDKVELFQCDFSRHQSIKEFSEKFKQKHDKLDILVNNAGGIVGEKRMTPDGFEWMFGVNHLGYFLTTHYLYEALKAAPSTRVVNVASMGHRFARLDWDNLNAEKSFGETSTYGLSKLCNILFAKQLAIYAKDDNITSNSLHPGAINSNFGQSGSALYRFFMDRFGSMVLITPVQGAQTSIYLATAPEVEGITGEHFAKKKIVTPSSTARNPRNAEILWEKSLEMTGIKEFGKV